MPNTQLPQPPFAQSTVSPGATSNAPMPTAPPGGFQQGGWYNSRQYWNGTFSQPGQINPLSNQVGAGQMVSPEVNAQTSVAAGNNKDANQTYINSQYGNINGAGTGAAAGGVTAAPTPTETDKAIDTLNSSMNQKRLEADKRRAEVNENPFLSEASRVGRIRRIDEMLNDSLQSDTTQMTYLTKKQADEKEAVKPDYQIETVTDNNGNVTVYTIDKKTSSLVKTISLGKVGKSSGTTAPTSNDLRGAILDAALKVDQNYKTVNGKLVTGDIFDKRGINKIGSYTDAGDKQLSRQELNSALDLAYANAGSKYTGSREEFAQIFNKVLAENGYVTWGD